MPTLRSHDDWQAELTRILDQAERRPARAAAALTALARATERAIPAGLNDWHLAQTWQHLSLAHARAGRHDLAATILGELAAHHDVLMTEHRRAYVAAAAASALHLVRTGALKEARAVLRRATRLGKGLTPQEQMLRVVKRHLAQIARRRPVTPTA